ncbi:hypothetical protein [uncultured Shewanella sp.]|uniref:hypothetical protein n=1 Tax=uncultured Shewanella sp. TaxID=173975 RepID=UPI0026362574|nr:hypothetical protein [uncultured Shewanella sp.]
MSFKKITLMTLFLITSLSSYTMAVEATSSLNSSATKSLTSSKQWLFVLSAQKGRIIKKSDDTFELSLSRLDRGVIAITDEPFRKSKILTSTRFLNDFNQIFSQAKPNAVLTYSGLLTGKKSPPITIVIQNVTVIPNFKVLLSLHPLSPNTVLPKGDIHEVKLFIDAATE